MSSQTFIQFRTLLISNSIKKILRGSWGNISRLICYSLLQTIIILSAFENSLSGDLYFPLVSSELFCWNLLIETTSLMQEPVVHRRTCSIWSIVKCMSFFFCLFFVKSVLNSRSVLSFRCTSSLVPSQKYWKRKWHFSGNSSHCCLLYILSQFHVWTVTIRSSVPHGQHEFIPLMYRWRTVVLSVQCMFWLVLTDWNFMKARWLLLNSVYEKLALLLTNSWTFIVTCPTWWI